MPATCTGIDPVVKLMLDRSLIGGLLLSPDWTILHANTHAVELLGSDSLSLMHVDFRTFGNGWQSPDKAEPRLSLSVDGMSEAEVYLHRPDQGAIWVRLSWTPLDSGGPEGHLLLWLQDVTPQKGQEILIQQAFENAPQPLMMVSRKQTSDVILANRRATTLFATAEEDLTSLTQILEQSDYQRFLERLQEAGHVDDFEILATTPYGETIWENLSGHIIDMNDERHILLSMVDITERKVAQANLKHFFDAAPLPMILIRLADSVILLINRRASELFSTSNPTDSPEDRHTLVNYIGPEQWTSFIQLVLGGGSAEGFEVELTTDYGETFSALLSGQVIEVGNERCLLIGVNDFTDSKRTENELKDAKDAAEKATHSKSIFLATMSHEIRTPMNGVIGMLDLLHETALDIDQRDMVDVIRDSAHALLLIINDILDLSKIEAEKLQLEEVPLSIHDLVESATELMAGRAREKSLDVAWRIEPETPRMIIGDQVRIRQILLNLVGNAIKFTKTGTINVSVTPSAWTEDTVTLCFSVADTGIGLPESQIPHLFEPFSQADASTTRRYGGTGLGLSICRRLVEAMQGRIWVESTEGEGSTFHFEITRLIVKDQAQSPSMRYVLDGLAVLVGAPDVEARQSMSDALTTFGAKVAPCKDLSSALLLLKQTPKPDLAIIDHKLLDAVLASALAEVLDAEHVLISLVNPSCPPLAARAFGFGTLPKPIRRTNLIRQISSILGITLPITTENAELPAVHSSSAAKAFHILVAEDNPTNRLVIGRQLSRLGYSHDMASDGEQAWAALLSRPYDLLLTDCFMPILDGYELTRRIRQDEQQRQISRLNDRPRLPIIALTANALQGDAEKCVSAGMDDYLSKPASMDVLACTLAKLLSKTPSPSPGPLSASLAATPSITNERPSVEKTAPHDQTPSLVSVDYPALGELIGDDDIESLRDIVAFFIECFIPLLEQLSDAVIAGDRQTLHDVAHSAKGASRNVCARNLAKVAQIIEHGAEKEEFDQLAAQVEHAKALFTTLRLDFNRQEQAALELSK